ncbi:MAG: type II toxin-antitoxin system VapC family toxin [Xanthomonadales bacterium]|nr:type II toxin-antitoxin system VapC family toxin [Xanthomonadales bacterium]
MVVDTSALVAIMTGEPEQAAFIAAIDRAETCLLSTVTLVEASIVMEARHGPGGLHLLELLIERSGMELVDVDAAQARLAQTAWRRFGKGRHPAGLNFGDCFPYALALARGEPLLFKGADFSQTDILPAVP